MYKRSDFTKASYKTGEVAKILNVTNRTIQNYDASGKLIVHRTESNRRCILRDDLLNFLDRHNLLYDDSYDERLDVIYARVSSHDQRKHGDLDRQVVFLLENTVGLRNPKILKEVGSGLNDKRKQLQKLIKMVCNDEVRNVYITHKDRLTSFGYNYFETMFLAHDVNIIVVQDKASNKSLQDELVDDMMILLESFSEKLYKLRSGRGD